MGAIRAMRRTAPPASRFRSMLILSFYDVTGDSTFENWLGRINEFYKKGCQEKVFPRPEGEILSRYQAH